MQKPLNILISCGGTGGHVFPGIATGQILQQRGHTPTIWLSGRRSVESETIHGWNGPVFRSGARPLGIANLPAFLATLWRVWREMRREHPDVVLAMGCYSSVPPVLVARMLGIPVVLHEANAVPGKAVALLSRFARVTALSFAASARHLPHGRRTVCTGMPMRTTLAGQPPLDGFAPANGGPGGPALPTTADVDLGLPSARAPGPTPLQRELTVGEERTGGRRASAAGSETKDSFTVLITGGSLGAHAVNELACEALIRLQRRGIGVRVIHQCGPADEATLRDRYAAAAMDAQVYAFLREMGRAYASADLAICRAGAATCFELCLCGVPAILIPLPSAVRDHQRLNAEAMVQSGGALLRLQANLTPDNLAADLEAIRTDPSRRAAMRQALLQLAGPDAAEKLADLVVKASEQ